MNEETTGGKGQIARQGAAGQGIPGSVPPVSLSGVMPGAPTAPPYPPESASGLAIASLVLSVSGFSFCGITAVVGIILGAVELGKIKRGESAPAGRNLALAGVIIGSVVLAVSIVLILFYILFIATMILVPSLNS